jgi:YidC/Oxa1 family membrane protein insertase
MSIPLLDGAVAAVYPFVAHLAAAVTPVGAIVLCTVVLRILLLPLTLVAVRGERARAAVAPQVAELRRRYGRDPVRLGTELSDLYRSAGTSPFAGFLPTLLQSPVLIVWYRIFTTARIGGQGNVLLAHPFLGAALSTRLLTGGHLVAFLPLLVLLVVLALVAVRRGRRVAAALRVPPPRGVPALLPFASVLGALVVPLAAVVYLVTTLAWTALENVLVRRGLPAR